MSIPSYILIYTYLWVELELCAHCLDNMMYEDTINLCHHNVHMRGDCGINRAQQTGEIPDQIILLRPDALLCK